MALRVSREFDSVTGGLSTRAYNILRREGVDTVDRLLAMTEADLRGMRNCNEKTVQEILDLQKQIDPRDPDITISVTRSAGDDRAVVVLIDTVFEPDGSDGKPGLRVLINDDEAYVGKAYDFGAHHEAGAVTFEARLDDFPYKQEENVAKHEDKNFDEAVKAAKGTLEALAGGPQLSQMGADQIQSMIWDLSVINTQLQIEHISRSNDEPMDVS